MSMERVLKYLDRTLARVPSKEEASSINPRTEKYGDLLYTRSIDKIFTYIILPNNDTPLPDSTTAGRLIFQYNVSLSQNFHIVESVKQSIKLTSGFLTVKFRVGSTVYRYFLWGDEQLNTNTLSNGGYRLCSDYPKYNGEIIGANCCFEFFRANRSPSPSVVRIKGIPELLIKTSLMINPVYAEQESIIQGTPILYTRTTIGFNTPITSVADVLQTGVAQDNVTFLDNVI